LYASYGKCKFQNPEWSNTHKGLQFKIVLNEYGDYGDSGSKPQNLGIKKELARSITEKAENHDSMYGESSPEKTPNNRNAIKPPKSIRKPPKAPRAAPKGENLYKKFNDSEDGFVNKEFSNSQISIEIDEFI